MLDKIVQTAPLFLLAAVRCFAMLMTLPLFSMRNVPRVAKIALSGYMAFMVLPIVYGNSWQLAQYGITEDVFSGGFTIEYLMLLLGEGLIGVIIGFYVSIIFAAFSSAGQFFSFQMGFSAAEAYDALSQVENPLMGQYLNLVAMLVFLQSGGFQKIFLSGILRSFESINALSLVYCKDHFIRFVVKGLSELFLDGLMIAFPLVGTLFLVSLTMGLLSKAAPQMNLLSEGLPITIIVAFVLLLFLLPVMTDLFERSFDEAYRNLATLFSQVSKAVSQ